MNYLNTKLNIVTFIDFYVCDSNIAFKTFLKKWI